ncbi:hypothetical protein XHV734_3467 [Xanthomonas hortorum pv. vitians]|nr:hypothetical protein XHV734_3467 [Xanthomonas hortorum pv. vitians]
MLAAVSACGVRVESLMRAVDLLSVYSRCAVQRLTFERRLIHQKVRAYTTARVAQWRYLALMSALIAALC